MCVRVCWVVLKQLKGDTRRQEKNEPQRDNEETSGKRGTQAEWCFSAEPGVRTHDVAQVEVAGFMVRRELLKRKGFLRAWIWFGVQR